MNRSAAGQRIRVWIFGLAALLIVLSASSLTFIAFLAWAEGDRQALEGDKSRFTGALQSYQKLIAVDQTGLAQWDTTFSALQRPVDRDFLENELIADLWDQFDLERTFIVGTDGNLIAQALQDNTRFPKEATAADPVIRQLAEQTRERFEARKRQSNSAFAEWYLPQSVLLEVSSSAYATIDGQPALLVAVPILPDYGRVRLTGDYPAVLVNAVHIDDVMIADLNDTLNYRDLRFHSGAPERMHPTNHLIWAADGSILGYFRWDHAKIGHQIWLMALPLIALITIVISLVAFAAAAKISRMSTKLEESERKNHYYAHHDALTGLPNRHHFADRLAYSIDGLPDQGFAIFACDLDRFKPVNDTFGHEAGDKVLRCVADRFERQFGKDAVVCRIGGDEFIVLLTEYQSLDELGHLAEKLKSAIADPIDIGGGESVKIGLSVGIATAPECGLDDKELIRMADMALYRAKESGRNAVEFAAPIYLSAHSDEKQLDLKSQSNS